MRRVLIVGHIWPYHSGAGNCIHAITKYLPEFGWEPVVLTAPLPEGIVLKYRAIEVPYHDTLKAWIKRFGFDTTRSVKAQVSQRLNITAKKSFLDFVFLRLNEMLTYPDSHRGWKSPALKMGSEIIEREGIQAIITDNPPITAHLIAHQLKQRYHLPWLVYFSHLWSQNNGYPFSPFRRWLDTRLELHTFSTVDVMITHSEPLAAKLREIHQGKKALATFEGYDPETVNSPPARLTDKFTITYTGSFAPELREPAMLLATLQTLLAKNTLDLTRIEVRFYGQEETWIEAEIERRGLKDMVHQYGKISMLEAQAKQRESQVLFNPKWDDPYEPGIYSGKIFEYLAARRPILATGKYKDVVDGLLRDTGAGVCTYSEEETERVLEAMYREYLSRGEVAYRGDTVKIDRLTHRELARTFAQELDRLASG